MTLQERLFAGVYPCGIVYADKGREVNGDYKRIAFLPYRTLKLEISDKSSILLPLIIADAEAMQKRKGEKYPIDAHHTVQVTLGKE